MKEVSIELTSEEVAQHVNEYLARGGKIEQVPSGISGFEFKNYTQAHRAKMAKIHKESE